MIRFAVWRFVICQAARLCSRPSRSTPASARTPSWNGTGSDATEGRWWPLDALPATAFDHDLALRDAVQRIIRTTPGTIRTVEFTPKGFRHSVRCSRCNPGWGQLIHEGDDPAEAETAYTDHIILHDLGQVPRAAAS